MENTLVWCKTKAQLLAVLTEAKRKGYVVDSPTRMTDNFWSNHHEETVVNLNGNGRSITYCYKDWYIEHPSFGKIITADKFFACKPILITRKGRVVTAENKNTGEKAIATCCPTDTFNFGTGAMIAVARLIAQSDKGITKDAETVLRQLLGDDVSNDAMAKRVYTDDDRNFRVGDKVVVRDWCDMAREYGTKDDSISIDGDSISFVPEMKHLCGRTATITDVNDDYVRVEFDDESGDTNWYYRRWMFNPSDSDKPTTKFKVGDLVTLKDDLEVHKRYDGITLLENMYRNGHRKPIKVIGVDCNEHYDCAPFSSRDGSTVSYWYSKEMLEKWDESKIYEGDIVRVVSTGKTFDTYFEWVARNVEEKNLIARFKCDCLPPIINNYEVVKIAPHGDCSELLAYIKSTATNRCYVVGINGLEKVTE